jgi:hypothetical protein
MGRRDRIRRDSSSNDSDASSIKLILLIVGLVIGVPALIGVVVLCVIFSMAYFAVKKTVEVGNELVQQANQHVEEVRAKDQQARLEAAAKKNFVPNLPPLQKIPGTNMSDLIALLDPVTDAVDFPKWEIVNNELVCKEGNFVPRIQIPYLPPAEYDFIATFSQPGLRNGISLIMPNPNGGSFFFLAGNEEGKSFGFSADPNKERKFNPPLKVDVKYTVTVQVRRNSVKAILGNTELMTLKTDFRDLSIDNWRQIPDPRLLAVACDDRTTFHQVRVIEINGTGKRMR